MPIGELEQVILIALARLAEGGVHGAAIIDEIETSVGRRVTPGALYTTLDRLQAKGLVEGWIGDSGPSRGGRRRKLYRLTPQGARELKAWYTGLNRFAADALGRLDAIAEGAR